MGFIFNKVGDKFRWENDEVVLEYSNPSIQAFSEFVEMDDEKDIMYYYYTVKLFQKREVYDEEKDTWKQGKWALIGSASTHDGPCIVDLKGLLEYQIGNRCCVDGQKIEYSSGSVSRKETLDTGGFLCDDYYKIGKEVSGDESTKYSIYIGFSLNDELSTISKGINIPCVREQEIKELQKCVSEFIEFSIRKNNEALERWKRCFMVKDSKVYNCFVDDKYNVNESKIESIMCVGDSVDIIEVVDGSQNSYDDVTVEAISSSQVTITNGKVIDVKNIRYMNGEPSDDMLTYNEQQIADDFKNILSDDEIAQFKSWTKAELKDKFGEAIVDRTWMCREEHKFDIDYSVGNRVEAVSPVVDNVINRIISGI